MIKTFIRINELGVNHLGCMGSGMACKVVNNFLAITGVVTVRKALTAASALGIDLRIILNIMKISSEGALYGDNFNQIC